MAINSCLSIHTLNVNGLHAPFKRRRISEWLKKQNPSIFCLQETLLRPTDICRLKVGDGEIFIMQIDMKSIARVAILTSGKIDFETKTLTRGKKGHYIIIKGKIQQNDVTVVNIYAPNMEAPK